MAHAEHSAATNPLLQEVRPAELPRAVLVENGRSFNWITEKICGIIEGKTPRWWWICFVLACFVGYMVIWNVTPALHTPLMSGANAIHGVILVGAIIVADHSTTNLELGLSVAAIILATINMVGGFVVTDRMLEMFKGNKK